MAAVDEHRPVKVFPSQMRHYISAYLEEGLFTTAFDLLLSILSSSSNASRAAFVPPPQYLALAATLCVHPSSKADQQASSAALQLLRLVNNLAGPVASGFADAFIFNRFAHLRTGTAAGDPSGGSLHLELAGNSSIWSHAEDFWHVVGWALNCSVLHPKRWARWRLFLELMCDILEDDWRERQKRFDAAHPADSSLEPDMAVFTESLICGYITATSSYTGRDRRIMKAIFADGSSTSVNEYGEVFYEELKEPAKRDKGQGSRKADVNIDDDIYGDYFDGVDSEEPKQEPDLETPEIHVRAESGRTKRQRRPARKKREANEVSTVESEVESPMGVQHDRIDYLGSLQSLAIRQRLLTLLSSVSKTIPGHFIGLNRLYAYYVEFIRHLPLATFQFFVSPSVLTYFPHPCGTTLGEMLLFNLLENTAPSSDECYLSQDKLEQCFLPFAANTGSVIDNARVSIVLESLIRILAHNNLIGTRPSLRAAVEAGIDARAEKVRMDMKRGQNKKPMEEFGWLWLIESGERMMYLVTDIIPEADKQPVTVV